MRIGVITSGGDAPGISAALYGMIRHEGDLELYGIPGGFDGILKNQPINLNKLAHNTLAYDGDLMLPTARSKVPLTEDGRKQLIASLYSHRIDCLVVCGGDGSFKAAQLLNQMGMPCVGIPMTIDNDIYGTDMTIGHNTCLANIRDAVQKLHQTGANMPGRVFMVETFGGSSSHLTLASGLAGGADCIIVPEFSTDMTTLAPRIQEAFAQGKAYYIILVSESAYREKAYTAGDQGVIFEYGQELKELIGIRIRYSLLGYLQRGGNPTVTDSLLALRMGAAAVEVLVKGQSNLMVAWRNGECAYVPLGDIVGRQKPLDEGLLRIARQKQLLLE